MDMLGFRWVTACALTLAMCACGGGGTSSGSDSDGIRFEANVAAVNGGTLSLAGLPGITVGTTAQTQFKNRELAQLAAGNNLRIRAVPGSSAGNVVATEVEFRSASADSRVILQAFATAVSAPTVTLLGIVVDTTPIRNDDFKGVDDTAIGRAAFFSAAVPGRLIKVRGTLSGSTVRWDQEIELER